MKKTKNKEAAPVAKNSSVSGSENRRYRWFFFILILLFSAIIKFKFHELWKDEWQAWLLATKTSSFSDLVRHLPSEGHPALWFFLLRSWHFLFSVLHLNISDEMQLQLFHYLLVAFAYYILFFRIKAPLWFVVAMVSGYFFFFEYGILDRGYILIVILCFTVTSFFQSGVFSKRARILLPLSFFLLTQAEVYGTIVGGSFLIYFFLQFVYKKDRKEYRSLFIYTGAVFLFGVILFYLQVSPDNSGSSGDLTFKQLSQDKGELFLQTFQSLSANLFCPGVFNTIYKNGIDPTAVAAGLVIIAGIVLVFYRSKEILLSFIACFIGFFVFTMVLYIGGPRQWGSLIIAFFCFYILSDNYSVHSKDGLKRKWIIGAVLLFQVVHSLRIIADEIRYPFSNSKAAGLYLRTNFSDDIPIVGINKFFCVPVAGYSGRPFYTMPSGDKFYFFQIDDWRGKMYIPSEKELMLFREYEKAPYIIVVFNKPLPLDRFPHMELLESFDQFNVRDENYYVYRL